MGGVRDECAEEMFVDDRGKCSVKRDVAVEVTSGCQAVFDGQYFMSSVGP